MSSRRDRIVGRSARTLSMTVVVIMGTSSNENVTLLRAERRSGYTGEASRFSSGYPVFVLGFSA
jgi:hypothetical protein